MTQSAVGDLIPAWVDGAERPVDKLEVHRRGLRHRAVSVFLYHEGALLLQKRAAAKYHTPGLWSNTCCTHPLWQERPEACAIRRLDEELGVTGVELSYRGQVEYRADVGGGMVEHELVDVFLAHVPARPPVALDADEVADTAWVSLDALMRDITARPDRYTPWLRIYLDSHREMVV